MYQPEFLKLREELLWKPGAHKPTLILHNW